MNVASLLIIAASLLTLSSCSKPAVAPTTPPESTAGSGTPVNNESSTVKLQTLDFAGIEKLIASHHGQVVVLDVWSTSCAPCVKEFPHLVELSHKYAADVRCISLSLDFDGRGKPEDVQPKVLGFLQKKQATFDNVLGSEEADALTKKLEMVAPPTVFVYDRQGQLRKRFDNRDAAKAGGPFTYEQIEALVKQLLVEQAN